MSSTKNNFTDINSAIEQVNKDNLIDVYVPSIGTFAKFSPLTVQHQKKIIGSALESASLNLVYSSLVSSEVIKTCCQDPTLNLLAIDRDPVMIGLRTKTLGYDVNVQDPEGEDIPFNIREHVDSFETIKPDSSLFEEKSITDNGITVKISPPNMKRDDTVNRVVIPEQERAKNKDDIKEMISSAVTYEYIKYIRSIQVGDTMLDFIPNVSKKLITVVESLPMSLSRKIVDEINKTKAFERKFTQISDEDRVLTIVTDARFYHSE